VATIKHAKTDLIADWTQADLDQQIAAGNYPPGTLLADIVLPSDWNNDHTLTGTVAIANGGTGATTLAGASIVTYTGTETLTNKTLTSPKVNLINDTNGNEILGFSPTTSATDYLVVKNGIGVGVPLHIYADGSSTNTGMHIQPKGTGLVTISDGTDFNKGIRFRSSSSAASAITLLDAVSTAGRVVTLPDATTTLVGRDTTDTLTNKSISGSTNTLSNIANASLTNSSITINGTAVSLGGTVTTPSGTVTSVGGTGTVSGISLSGTVTSSGNLTLGGTLDLSSPPTIGNTTPNTGAFTSVTTPSVTATTTDLTLSAISTGAVKFNTLGGLQAQVSDVASSDSYVNLSGGVGSATVAAGSSAGSIDLRLDSRSSGNVRLRTAGGTEQLRVSHTASAVNYVQVTGGTTGNSPVISGQGSDAAVALSITSKSTNAIRFLSNNAANLQFRIVGTNTAVNNLAVTGTIATNAPSLSSEGSDTNISMAFQPKGTGAIDLATGSSGVNISNGGTVTAITRTATGSGYSSFPTVTVSPPTTAGGVQAVVAVSAMGTTTATVVSGGTGYTVGDTLTVTGISGTGGTFTVSTVSSGVVTGITSTGAGGSYTAIPTNPVTTSGGTGTGCTLNLSSYYVISVGTITNAGSGYIEQPTITFSGGGGSGAAAYASVGSGIVFKSLNGTLSFYMPFGETVRMQDGGALQNGYITMQGSTTTSGGAYITSSASSLYLSASSGNSVQFFTNGGGSTRQFQVSHTASAVNYVQVTGAVTTGTPVIQAQGSDTNVSLAIRAKNLGGVYLQPNSLNQLGVTSTASAVNYHNFTGAIAGSAPVYSVLGTDTDISMLLVPKGLGIVYTNQQTPVAVDATNTLTIANLLTQIVTTTSATAVSLTLPTGTLTDAGISGGTSAVNTSFEWSIVNLGSAVGAITLVAGTAHTIVGSTTIAINTSARFKTRKTATNTFITYRIA